MTTEIKASEVKTPDWQVVLENKRTGDKIITTMNPAFVAKMQAMGQLSWRRPA